MSERLQALTADEMRSVLGGHDIVEELKERLGWHRHPESAAVRRTFG